MKSSACTTLREMFVVFCTIAGELREELGLTRKQVAIRHIWRLRSTQSSAFNSALIAAMLVALDILSLSFVSIAATVSRLKRTPVVP
jgi:hypothetical protein